MRTYDTVCPACGRVNHNLYLEETDGWMECECCGQLSQAVRVEEDVRLPLFTLRDAMPKAGIA